MEIAHQGKGDESQANRRPMVPLRCNAKARRAPGWNPLTFPCARDTVFAHR